jgi:hypothetical protein
MELKLHANARTTPNTRAYIQNSGKSVAELGVSETTIRRDHHPTLEKPGSGSASSGSAVSR